MKNEEIDWAIFHMIPEGAPTTISKLAENSGFDRETVTASLERLENSCLISVMGETVSALSIDEYFMMNEVKNEMPSFLEIENGVIKVRK